MMFEHTVDIRPDRDVLHRIAQEVSDHADKTCLRQLDKDRDVRAMLFERRVRGMPDPLPTEDAAPRFDLDPFRIEGMAAVTQPLRPELPRLAMAAALHKQPVMAQSGPVRSRQPIRLGHRDWKAGRKIGRTWITAHSVASEPRRRLLTGVTIGPPITMATSLRGAWLVELPRTWRTASSTSSKPCM